MRLRTRLQKYYRYAVFLHFRILPVNGNILNQKIRIRFDLEFRPQSAIDDKDYFVDIEADNKDLRRIADDLKNEYEKYPERRKPAP